MLNSTNYTPIKKTLPCSLLQELEAQEEIGLEELLQAIDTLEEFFQDLPSSEDQIAQTEQLTDHLCKALLASELDSKRIEEVLHGQKE